MAVNYINRTTFKYDMTYRVVRKSLYSYLTYHMDLFVHAVCCQYTVKLIYSIHNIVSQIPVFADHT